MHTAARRGDQLLDAAEIASASAMKWPPTTLRAMLKLKGPANVAFQCGAIDPDGS